MAAAQRGRRLAAAAVLPLFVVLAAALTAAVVATSAAPRTIRTLAEAAAEFARTDRDVHSLSDEQAWIAWLAAAHRPKGALSPAQRKVATTLLDYDALGRADAISRADPALARRVYRLVAAGAVDDAEVADPAQPMFRRRRSGSSGARRRNGLAHADEDEVDTMVDIAVTEVTEDVLALLERVGAQVLHASVYYRTIRARLPLGTIETVAEHPDVHRIQPGLPARINKVNTSQGVTSHNVSFVRDTLGAKGAGVKIGVISDSASQSSILNRQATGDLGTVAYIVNQQGAGSDEGTAMMEIVYDMAPESEIIFATGTKSPAQMGENIRELARAGCSVIVDDIGWSSESPLHDTSPISDAVADVTKNGTGSVVYVSSAGNSYSLRSGFPTVWRGAYKEIAGGGSNSAHFHDWGAGSSLLRIRGTARPAAILLWWSDPLTASSNDYDLYLANSNGDIVALSEFEQSGNGDEPIEFISLSNSNLRFDTNDYYVAVNRFGATSQPRYLYLMLFDGSSNCYFDLGTDGSTFGHPTTRGAIGVGAVQARSGGGSYETTPASSLRTETFSSDGPARLFYGANGNTPITPGNLLTGGITRKTPILSGADGVSTATPGFSTFFGTSAAAPHVAALIGLVKSAVSADAILINNDIVELLKSTALRVGAVDATGWNATSGWGLPRIAPVIQALKACGAGSYVDTATLACTPCPNGRAIPAGSAGAGACTNDNFDGGAAGSTGNVEFVGGNNGGLSGGAVAGLVIGLLVLAALLIIGAAVYMRSRSRSRSLPKSTTGSGVQLVAMPQQPPPRPAPYSAQRAYPAQTPAPSAPPAPQYAPYPPQPSAPVAPPAKPPRPPRPAAYPPPPMATH